MSHLFRRRYLTFSLSSLFVLMTAVAIGTSLYVRATKMHRICSELYELRCPVVYTGSIPETEYDSYCFMACSTSGPDANQIAWTGLGPAVVGRWETKRFTAFVRPGALDPIYQQEEYVLNLILELPHLDTIVICAGGTQRGTPSESSEFLTHPLVKRFVETVRQRRPSVRIIVQPFVAIG